MTTFTFVRTLLNPPEWLDISKTINHGSAYIKLLLNRKKKSFIVKDEEELQVVLREEKHKSKKKIEKPSKPPLLHPYKLL